MKNSKTTASCYNSVLITLSPKKIVILKGRPNQDIEADAEAATMKAFKKTSFRYVVVDIYLDLELRNYRRPQDIVYVVVGSSKQKFGMHKDQLCATSPYFKAAFEGKFQEADLGEVTLRDTSVSAFGMFNEWLYTGEIAEELCQDEDLTKTQLHNKDKPTFRELLDAWSLADYLLVPRLQNYIVDMMQARYKKRWIAPTTQFSYFYENTQKGSPMRKFMVDLCVWRWYDESSKYLKYENSFPPEMTMDLLVALARRVAKEDENPFKIAGHYHVPVKD